MNLFVGNLSSEVTTDDLKTLFAEFGTVINARIIYDTATNTPRGFGFVEYADKGHAMDAIDNLDMIWFMGQIISVKEAKSKTPASGTSQGGYNNRTSGGSRPSGGFRPNPSGPNRREGSTPYPRRDNPQSNSHNRDSDQGNSYGRYNNQDSNKHPDTSRTNDPSREGTDKPNASPADDSSAQQPTRPLSSGSDFIPAPNSGYRKPYDSDDDLHL
jgi:RNA recognition motif-containing protein